MHDFLLVPFIHIDYKIYVIINNCSSYEIINNNYNKIRGEYKNYDNIIGDMMTIESIDVNEYT